MCWRCNSEKDTVSALEDMSPVGEAQRQYYGATLLCEGHSPGHLNQAGIRKAFQEEVASELNLRNERNEKRKLENGAPRA